MQGGMSRYGRGNGAASVLDQYLDDTDRIDCQPLSREEESALATRIRQGDLQARNALVQANLHFVVYVAKHYRGLGLSLAELISAGNLGLITAAERFDGGKGFKFISYAVFWIRQSIQRSLARQTRLVHLPAFKQLLLRNAWRMARHLGQEGEEEPEMEALAEALDTPIQDLRDLRDGIPRVCSLDQAFGEEDSLLNKLPDSSRPAPDADALRTSGRERLARILADLNEREPYSPPAPPSVAHIAMGALTYLVFTSFWNEYTGRWIARNINNPEPVHLWHLSFGGIGVVLMALLTYIKGRSVGFPIHPIGMTLGLTWPISEIWFSVFIAWIFKALILKYGGARLYLKLRPFFLGMVLGAFSSAGF